MYTDIPQSLSHVHTTFLPFELKQLLPFFTGAHFTLLGIKSQRRVEVSTDQVFFYSQIEKSPGKTSLLPFFSSSILVSQYTNGQFL
jgi:hypothetical protein